MNNVSVSLLPCPNPDCRSTDIEPDFAYGELDGSPTYNAGCMVCAMTGPQKGSMQEAAIAWNKVASALAQPSEQPAVLACYDCGLPYADPGFADFVVPDDVWLKISPTGNEGGILCATHMFRRMAALGITCEGRFTSGPCAQHDWKKPASSEQPAKAEQPGDVGRDEARLAVFHAIEAIKIGNKTDDKLIVEELRKAGYGIARLGKDSRVDRYGLALMMIREGCAEPERVAANALAALSPSVPAEAVALRKLPPREMNTDAVYLMRVDFLRNGEPDHDLFLGAIGDEGELVTVPDGDSIGWDYNPSDDDPTPTWAIPVQAILACAGAPPVNDEAVRLIAECDEYLDSYGPGTSIGRGSLLHRKMKAVLASQHKEKG